MCLAIPGKIKSVELQYDGRVRMAKINFGGIIKEASLEMLLTLLLRVRNQELLG